MLQEYKHVITSMKAENAHFAKMFERHNELDQKIDDAESGKEYVEPLELDTLKKEKLKLKDDAYAMIMDYKKENNI